MGQAVGVEVDFESSTLMPARPMRAGTIAIVVIQDAAFGGPWGGRQGITHEYSSESTDAQGRGSLLELCFVEGLVWQDQVMDE